MTTRCGASREIYHTGRGGMLKRSTRNAVAIHFQRSFEAIGSGEIHGITRYWPEGWRSHNLATFIVFRVVTSLIHHRSSGNINTPEYNWYWNTRWYTTRHPEMVNNHKINSSIVNYCMVACWLLVAGCWWPSYMLVTGLLIAGYWVTGHRFMVPPLVACCGLPNNKSWHVHWHL